MWFGNLITMKWWNDLWLNESFATQLSFIAQEGILDLGYSDKVWPKQQYYMFWAIQKD
jgi:aminopeptidase N